MNDFKTFEQNQIEEANNDFIMLELISKKIMDDIKTEQYKKLNGNDIRGFHFDREEF